MKMHHKTVSVMVAALAATMPLSSVRAASPAAPASSISASSQTESQRFLAFLNGIYERNLKNSPMMATTAGFKQGHDKWDDMSAKGVDAAIALVRQDIKDAKANFDYARLDERSQLQYRVFMDEEKLLLDRYRWRDHFYPLNQIVGLHVEVPDILINQQTVDNTADAKAYISRINGVKTLFGQLTDQMKAQAVKGFYMPKRIYPILIADSKKVITGAPFDNGPDSAIWADFKRKVAALNISDAEKSSLTAQAETALKSSLRPAYESLIALLAAQEAKTTIDGGVWQMKDGDAFYAFLVRQFTTTKMTPNDIHELGLREVARVQNEMRAVMKRVGATGSVIDFMAKTKADPKQYYPDTDAGRMAYLTRAKATVAAMEAKIPEYFLTKAPLPLEVRRTQAYKENSAPTGYYDPGSADGKRPGIVNLNLANMKIMPIYDMDDLLYHEGVPGHHMQISLIAVDKSIPELRKVDEWWQDSAFVEGWGLYAEGLAKDMGFYQDPYDDFGRLSGELWRACRLVVDSGLHYKRWTPEQAVEYLDKNTPSSHAANILAVDRYMAVPGQATSFMIGMKKFRDDRERARAELGSAFDIREYHNVVLRNGYIPLWAVDEAVNNWVAAKKARIVH